MQLLQNGEDEEERVLQEETQRRRRNPGVEHQHGPPLYEQTGK